MTGGNYSKHLAHWLRPVVLDVAVVFPTVSNSWVPLRSIPACCLSDDLTKKTFRAQSTLTLV